MRYIFIILAIFFLSFFSPDNVKAELKIYMSPVPRDGKGNWILFVYDNPDDFPTRPEKALVKRILPLHTPQPVRISLPPGEYAVALFLDENGNGKIDRNFLGIPTEPYALSGHPRFHFGPPRFEECKINVQAPETVLRLRIAD